MTRLTIVAGLIFGLVAASTVATAAAAAVAGINDDDDGTDSMSVDSLWDDSRLDERIYADPPNFLTYQLSHKRYAVPYHPVARSRSSQSAGVVLPYAMIANRNYADDGNRFEPVWKPTAADLLSVLINRRLKSDAAMDNTNFMRFGISKRDRYNYNI